MKFKLLYLFFGLSLALFVLNSNSQGRANASGAGNTGAPGDQATTCITCHGTSAAIEVSLDIQVDNSNGQSIINTGYTGGETYDVTITMNTLVGSPSGFGFQALALIAALNSNGPQAGSWSSPANNVQISAANNRSYAEHDGPSDSNEFKFKWTAPQAGSGVVTFYSCGNGVNRNNATSGDNADCSTLVIEENITSSVNQLEAQVELNTFPNPVQDELQIDLKGEIAGEYQLRLIDRSGKMVYSQVLRLINGENRERISLGGMAAGLYALRIDGKNGSISRTIIKF